MKDAFKIQNAYYESKIKSCHKLEKQLESISKSNSITYNKILMLRFNSEG